MKLKQNRNKAVLSITKREWMRLGQDAGWNVPDEIDDDIDDLFPPIPESNAYNVEVGKYSERTWGVWLDGDLLCVAVYKKGAMAVKALIEDLAGKIQMMEGFIAGAK